MARKKKEPEPKKGNWIVRLKRTVVTEIYCDNCTEQEAEENPWDHVRSNSDELEIEQTDWDFISLEPND